MSKRLTKQIDEIKTLLPKLPKTESYLPARVSLENVLTSMKVKGKTEVYDLYDATIALLREAVKDKN